MTLLATLARGTAIALGLAAPAAAQDAKDTVVIARDTDFNTLDPSRSWCDSCQIYLTAAYEQLVRVGSDNQTIEPLLATEWTVSDDGLTHRFTLDPDATFADGSPVEAADVAFSLERLRDLEGGAAFLAEGIASVEAPGPGHRGLHARRARPGVRGQAQRPLRRDPERRPRARA